MTATPSSEIVRGIDAAGRPCVFKRLRAEHAAREDLALRLRNEGEVLTRLRGTPGIIRLLDVRDDPLTLVLEFADGGSLDDRLADVTWPPGDRARVASDLVAAVSGCHVRGVIHRDIKPSNVLFVRESLRLADFGVAAWGNPPRALPEGWEEDAVGTPPWSAPELQHRASRHTSPAVDVYGVARVVQALLPEQSDPELSVWIAAALDDEPHRRPALAELARNLERARSP